MKKKIKDLTLEEVKEICKKHGCNFCPLCNKLCGYSIPSIIFSNALDQEIEVDSNEEKD